MGTVFAVHVLTFGSILLMVVAAPIYQSLFDYPGGEGIYALFSNFCHQYPTRSFWITDRPMAICSRCTGGYLGLALAPFFFCQPLAQSAVKIGASMRFPIGGCLLALAITDPVLEIVGFYSSFVELRFMLGFLGGVGLFLLCFPMRLSSMSTFWGAK